MLHNIDEGSTDMCARVCMYACVCVCVCIYACMYVCVRVCMRPYLVGVSDVALILPTTFLVLEAIWGFVRLRNRTGLNQRALPTALVENSFKVHNATFKIHNVIFQNTQRIFQNTQRNALGWAPEKKEFQCRPDKGTHNSGQDQEKWNVGELI